MASNEMEAYNRAYRAWKDAVAAKANPQVIAQLKAAAEAAFAKTGAKEQMGQWR